MCFNNSFNAFIEKFFNEVCYEFKIKKTIYVVIAIKNLDKNLDKNVKAQLNDFEATWLRYRQKIANVIFYVSILFKIKYDSMHISLLLKSRDKAFLRFHRNYMLLDKHNKKLNNQRTKFFLVKRCIKRLAYELDLSFKWCVHLVISITQLKLVSKENDLYNRSRFNYFTKIEVEDVFNILWMKFY